MLSLTISTIVFFVSAWFLNSYLDAQGLSKGLTRGMMVVLASLMSWGAGWAVDWTQVKAKDPQASVQPAGGLSQILKTAGQSQP